jgi:hypothetical protein
MQEVGGQFFAILEAAMSSPEHVSDPALREGYKKLFQLAGENTHVSIIIMIVEMR